MKESILTMHEIVEGAHNAHDHATQISASRSDSDVSSDDEASQNGPSKKRKRPMKISCELCKARKVRCDRAEPACGWCARNDRVCIYKERKKPGLKASYGVELEDKIKQLESALQTLTRRVDHISSTDAVDRPTTFTTTNQSHDPPSIRSIDGPRPYSPSYHQLAWSSSAPDQSSRSHEPQDALPVPPILSPAEETTASSDLAPIVNVRHDESDFPPAHLLYNLVDTYFKHVNTWSPILDRKATLDSLFGTTAVLGESEAILLHAIITVTLRFYNDPQLTPDAKRRHHEISRHKVQIYALETPSITAMKALALITVDALGTSDGPHSWNLLALLSRNIVQLGLGREKSVYVGSSEVVTGEMHDFLLPQPNSWIEDEGRRRLFWLTYILDRYATVATNFDFVLDDREINRPLPCRYDLFSKNQPVETRWFRGPNSTETTTDRPENLGSFSYHCEVLRILSQIHIFLRAPIDIDSATEVQRWRDTYRELDSKLNTWLSHLPGEYGKISQLCHSDPGSRVSNWIMIHAAFVTSVIRLHSVAAYPSVHSHIFTSSYNAAQRCLAAVESLRAIAQDVIDTSALYLLGPQFAFSLWVSGRLLLVHAATTTTTVDPEIWFLTSTLQKMGQYWAVARRWAEVLTRLVHEGEQADQDSRQGRAVSSGKTYGEMRKCAHDLGLLTTRQPATMIDPPATRTTSSNELEYYDVFEWFNNPKLPSSVAVSQRHHPYHHQSHHREGASSGPNSGPAGYAMTVGRGQGGVFSTPDPDNDWLNFKQPYEFKPPYE